MTRLWPLIPLLVAAAICLPHPGALGWVLDDRWLLAPGFPASPLAHWLPGATSTFTWRPMGRTVQHLWGLAFGVTPDAFRALNLCLHATNLLLLQAVARRSGCDVRGAALAASAWAVHPALPDTVLYQSATFDLLATTAALAALLTPPAGGLALGFVAMLCKETAAPVFLLLAGVHRRPLLLLPGAGLLACWGAWHTYVTGQPTHGAVGLESVSAWLQAVPWVVTVPSQAGVTHLFDPGDPWRLLAGGLALVGLLLLARRPTARPGVAAWLLMLVPVGLGVPVTGVQALRYVYLPSALAVALGAAAVPWGRRLACVGLAVWTVLQAPLAWSRAGDWRDEGTLWRAELSIEPANPLAKRFAGLWLVRSGRTAEDRRAGLRLWADALATPLPRPVGLLDVVGDRYELAQAAFLEGDYALARDQARAYVQAAGDRAPANAWCLVADATERLGEPVPADVEARCAAR